MRTSMRSALLAVGLALAVTESACGGGDGDGGGGGGGGGGNQPTPTLAVLAGIATGRGNADGTGAAARFSIPFGVAVDGSGNVYVADSDNHTIRKITPAGVVTTLAGAAGQGGSTDGTGSAARFNGPYGVAVDESGNVYVADTYNHTIRKVTPAGEVTTAVGVAGHGAIVAGPLPASLVFPHGVAVDPTTGDLFITVDDAVLVASF